MTVMVVNDEGMRVTHRRMAVGMTMRLGSLPAFVLVLMMRVVDMQVLVVMRLVRMLELDRIS